MPPDEYGTGELFPVPKAYRPPKRAAPLWREWRGRRTSCDDCILALARGEIQFLAEPARLVRSDGQGTHYYCHQHARVRRLAERD